MLTAAYLSQSFTAWSYLCDTLTTDWLHIEDSLTTSWQQRAKLKQKLLSLTELSFAFLRPCKWDLQTKMLVPVSQKNVLIEQNPNQKLSAAGLYFTMNMTWDGLIRLSLSKKRPNT